VTAPFHPDWRLDPPDALAVVMRIALHRRGVEFGDALATDEQWSDMCSEIIAAMATGISPMQLVELPREWDEPNPARICTRCHRRRDKHDTTSDCEFAE
jgi:hypothetical protein